MKTCLIYGLAMAVAGAALAMALYLLGFHSDPQKLTTAQMLGMVGGLTIGAVCIALGTKARREELPPQEEFGYARALGVGVMIAVFASLFNLVTSYAYMKFVNPEFVDVIVQAQMQKMEERNMPAAQMEAAEKMIRRMTNPVLQALFGSIGGVVTGTVISLVTAAVLKRPAAPPGLPPVAA